MFCKLFKFLGGLGGDFPVVFDQISERYVGEKKPRFLVRFLTIFLARVLTRV